MRIELKNEKIWVTKTVGTFHVWSDDAYKVTVQEFDEYAYIQRLDVEEGHRGKGLGTAIVQTLKERFGTVITAPKDEHSRGFCERVGEKDFLGELNGKAIFPLDLGYGVYIME